MKNLIPALWVAILPFLSQVSVSDQWISFTETDVSSVETAIFNWGWSVFDMIIQFGPVLIWVVVLFMVLRWLWNKL